MNVFAISSIVQCTRMQFDNILRYVEGRTLLVPVLPMSTKKHHVDDGDGDNDEDGKDDDNSGNSGLLINATNTNNISNDVIDDALPDDVNYMVSSSALTEILQYLDISNADSYLFQNLFTLADKRGYDLVDIKDVLTLFAVVLARSVEECLHLAILVHDRRLLQIVDKAKLIHIFTLLNESCCYFGDTFLTKTQILDLADSIYTNAGKIDGEIVYADFLQFMAEHPIVEMLISIQFQGTVQDKYLDDEAFGKIELIVDI